MIEFTLIAVSLILLISALASKISDRFGVPSLLLFLVLGMLLGSDGPGGIHFDHPALVQLVGVVALVFILFSGGLDTKWTRIRPVIWYGVALSTVGVLLTALIVGLFAQWLFEWTLLEGLLLGAIVSSTDAAAVFSVLRSKGLGLRANLKDILELESGSNDPMAVFLTTSLIQALTQPEAPPARFIGLFLLQMFLGALIGYGLGQAGLWLFNRARLGYDGLYPVMSIALIVLTYALANVAGGNGFLAVYVSGIFLGGQDFIHKKSLSNFHDGLAWLMQIAMFLTLGLQVFPSRLVTVILPGTLIAACLIFAARPVSVFLSLLFTPFTIREKAFLSWVGLRGAVPIILATYPLLARIEQAELIFNVVFFVVLFSTLLQGSTLPPMARWLRVDAPIAAKRTYPIEYTPGAGLKSELREMTLPAHSGAIGKAIVELGLPDDFLIVLIARDDEYLIPSGGTILKPGDVLLVLSETPSFERVWKQISNGR